MGSCCFAARPANCGPFVSLRPVPGGESAAIGAGIDNVGNDLFNSKQNIELLRILTDSFNLDTVTNNNSYEMIEQCKSLDLKIFNGKFGADFGEGNYSCHKHNGESMVY